MSENSDHKEEPMSPDNDYCAICLDTIKCNNRALVHPCGHPFCLSCLKYWLQFRTVCPLCLQTSECIIKDGSRDNSPSCRIALARSPTRDDEDVDELVPWYEYEEEDEDDEYLGDSPPSSPGNTLPSSSRNTLLPLPSTILVIPSENFETRNFRRYYSVINGQRVHVFTMGPNPLSDGSSTSTRDETSTISRTPSPFNDSDLQSYTPPPQHNDGLIMEVMGEESPGEHQQQDPESDYDGPSGTGFSNHGQNETAENTSTQHTGNMMGLVVDLEEENDCVYQQQDHKRTYDEAFGTSNVETGTAENISSQANMDRSSEMVVNQQQDFKRFTANTSILLPPPGSNAESSSYKNPDDGQA